MRRVLASLVVAVFIAACGSDGSGTEDSSAATDPVTSEPVSSNPEEAGDPIEDFLDDDGVLSLDSALQIFAAAMGPLPGVTAPELDHELHGMSLVLRVLDANREQLSAEQQAAIDEALGPVGAPLDELLASSGQGAGMARDELLRQVAAPLRNAQNFFAGELGRSLPFAVHVSAFGELEDGIRRFPRNVLADATTRTVDGRTVCAIRFNRTAARPAQLAETAAHEMFHCFQFAVDDGRLPAWVAEGSAEWAGAKFVGGGSSVAQEWAQRWVETPSRAITRRSYDALGVYVLGEEAGASMFSYIDRLLASPNIATLRAAVGPALDVEWGLSYAGQSRWGAPYALTTAPFTGQGTRYELIQARVNAGPAVFPQPPADRTSGAQVYSLAAEGDVLVISGSGFGGLRFDNGQELRFNGAFAADYCLIPGGCVCPNGTSTGGGGRAITAAGSRSLFVGWGPSADLTPQLEVQTLEQWCIGVPAVLPPTGDPCMIGTWTSTAITTPAVNGSAPLQGGSGVVAVFNADSTFSVNFDNMTPLVGPIDETISVEMSYGGATVGTWAVDANGKYTGGGDASSVRVVARLTGAVDLVVFDKTLAELVGSTGSTATPPGTYRVADCSAVSLTLTTGASGGEASMVFQRTG